MFCRAGWAHHYPQIFRRVGAARQAASRQDEFASHGSRRQNRFLPPLDAMKRPHYLSRFRGDLDMSKLTTEKRDSVPDRAFAGPGRTYPIEDAAHARDAKARASAEYHRGRLTRAEFDAINASADAVLKEAGRGGEE
jgi:hypothetical protein